jgi:Carboxypeptidase regulatory-like domain
MIRKIAFRRMKFFFVSMFVVLVCSFALGQGGAATGDLQITVKDAKGNGVSNATVTVSDIAKGVARTATGDGLGNYVVRQLPPGVYTATVEAPGFAKAQARDVSITVGRNLTHLVDGHDRAAPDR